MSEQGSSVAIGLVDHEIVELVMLDARLVSCILRLGSGNIHEG